jgi:signal transduction histidine kinase/CheY-like chemotaxis protein
MYFFTALSTLFIILSLIMAVRLAWFVNGRAFWLAPLAIFTWFLSRTFDLYTHWKSPSETPLRNGHEIFIFIWALALYLGLIWAFNVLKRDKSIQTEKTNQIERLLNQQIAINQLTLSLGETTTLDEVYTVLYRYISQFMDTDAFMVSRYAPDENAIYAEHIVIHDAVQDVSGFPPLPMGTEGEGSQSRVIRSGKPIYIPDWVSFMKTMIPPTDPDDEAQDQGKIYHVGSDGEISEALPEDGDDIQSALLVPMRVGGRVLGVMQVQSYRLDAYTQADIDLLSGLANVAAVAVQNARLLAQTEAHTRHLQYLLDEIPVGVVLLDRTYQLQLSNNQAKAYLPLLLDGAADDGVMALGQRPLPELLQPPESGLWHELNCNGRYFSLIPRKITFLNNQNGWMLVIQEITEIKEIQNHLQEQDRLAAVGQLAAGIAHDFNNILAVILLYAQLLANNPHLNTKHKNYLSTIISQSNRASSLIQQILDFSRRSILERQALNLKPYLKEIIQFMQRTLPENINITITTHTVWSDDFTIFADPTRIQQLVMNLCLNGRDAMPDGGQLVIHLSQVEIAAQEKAPLPDMGNGRWIQLTISDTGSGIPANILPHIFDPFFTTKSAGKGNGLGLAQVYGIVKQHDGAITVHSELEHGTTFDIYFPVYQQQAALSPQSQANGLPLGQNEQILVVEDNESLAETLVNSLESLQYRPVVAKNGKEALAILNNKPHEIALILSDIIMPEMDGITLFEEIMARNITVPFVPMTGYTLDQTAADLRQRGAEMVLQKPINLKNLAVTLSTIIQKQSSAANQVS